MMSDDHRAHEPEAAPRPSEGAVLPASLHAGAGAHRRPAAPGVVGTSASPRALQPLSIINGPMRSWRVTLQQSH